MENSLERIVNMNDSLARIQTKLEGIEMLLRVGDKPYLTSSEALAVIGYKNKASLTKWAEAGVIRRQECGKEYRYSKPDCLEFVERRREYEMAKINGTGN